MQPCCTANVRVRYKDTRKHHEEFQNILISLWITRRVKVSQVDESNNLCFFETVFLNYFCIRLLYTSLQDELVISRDFESRQEKALDRFCS